MRKLLKLAVACGTIALVVHQWPSIRRYLRMERM
ncbi:DUF6893 family small protein [Nonomuraea pusilla]